MLVEQIQYSKSTGWVVPSIKITSEVQIVLAFAPPILIKEKKHFNFLKKRYPKANIIMTSSAGEIYDATISDVSISVCAISFEKTKVRVVSSEVKTVDSSFSIGVSLTKELKDSELKHLIVFSEGLCINGTQLVKGIETVIQKGVGVSGGLAGDGPDFNNTIVTLNGSPIEEKIVVIIGFYGKNIEIGSSSVGGWDSFGQKRRVTKSKDNIVYELDNEPVLDLYKKYLGELAAKLPSSGLLFPLNITPSRSNISVVRTLLGINEEEKSMTFAGDIEQGSTAELMKSNFERLIDGAGEAASNGKLKVEQPVLAILISCVGRKLVLKQRTEEELEIIKEILGNTVTMTGFYSYGEIGPSEYDGNDCKLHNQTMTITLISEK